MAYIAGCGGNSNSTVNTILSPLVTPPNAPTSRTVLGGSIQGVGAPVLAGNVITFAGSSAGFSDNNIATGAMFNRPIAITTDGTNLYVADYYNNAIRQIVISSGAVTTIAGNGAVDNNGVAVGFNLPTAITTDGAYLYVTDSGSYTIRRINLTTRVVTTLAGSFGLPGYMDDVGLFARFNILSGITTDGSYLYVTDSGNTIRRIVISSGAVTTLAGTPGTAGSVDGIQTSARFNLPARITTDGPNLYVADFGNSTIRKIALATGAVTTIAGSVWPGGPGGYYSDSTDGTGLTARFNQPNGITTDGTNLYVTDSYDNTVRKIVLSSGTTYSGPVTTIAGSTTGAAGSVDANGTAAGFHTPMGITTDGTSLFITDIENQRIRKIQ
jgi:sugar lactone lactonase YvrE